MITIARFMDDVLSTTVGDELSVPGIFSKVLNIVDFDLFAIGSLYQTSPSETSSRPCEFHTNYPPGWVGQYLESKYFSYDPIVQLACFCNTAFNWESLGSSFRITKMQNKIMKSASEFRIGSGLSIGLHHLNGRVNILSFARQSSRPISHVELQRSSLLGHMIDALWMNEGTPRSYGRVELLTARERECLTWAAVGKSSRDIADIIGVSANTVDFHIKNSMRKLDCATRRFAIVKALRQGLINP